MTNRKSTKAVSAEQKRAEMEALHAKLAAEVEALRDSERWAAYLRFMGSFHRYSFNNMLLIFTQRPDATRVAGYRAWQAKGRQVRRGEQSIRILAPCTVKVEMENVETGETEEATRLRFKPTSVFDMSQTDPIEGREDVSEVARPLVGEDTAGIVGRVVDYLAAQDVPVTFEEITSGAHGYTTPADDKTGEGVRVVIDSRLSPAHQAKTAIHEAAHIALGHVENLADYIEHRGRCEVEAESVAYVVAGLMGLDASSYSTGYVAGWMQTAEADVLKDTAAAVLAAVHALAEALAPAEESTPAADLAA